VGWRCYVHLMCLIPMSNPPHLRPNNLYVFYYYFLQIVLEKLAEIVVVMDFIANVHFMPTYQIHRMFAPHAWGRLGVLYWLYSQCFNMATWRLNCAYIWQWNGALHYGDPLLPPSTSLNIIDGTCVDKCPITMWVFPYGIV
jgi:hypothetical protein